MTYNIAWTAITYISTLVLTVTQVFYFHSPSTPGITYQNTCIILSPSNQYYVHSKNTLEYLPLSLDDFEIEGYYVRNKGKWELFWTLTPKSEILITEGYAIAGIQILGFLENKDGSLSLAGDFASYSFSPPINGKWSKNATLNGKYNYFNNKRGFKPGFFQLNLIYIDNKKNTGTITSPKIKLASN